MSEADSFDEGDMFDPKTSLGGVLISNKNRTAKTDNNASGKMTVKGQKVYTSGRHEVRVKLDSGSGLNWYVGICNSTATDLQYTSSQTWYFDVFNSSKGSSKVHSGNFSLYANKCKVGQIVTVVIDMDKKQLSFKKGNEDLGVAFNGIPQSVCFCVQMRQKNRQLSIC
ncbi:spry domain containing socs box protein [Anaeramoeba flamelloides]|uniref:Spry domain containing socs box protein n=1 Tax=Anaeramoeba flamelloides TaxID=1746091 RepID=A0AAV7Z5G8_9EUKA|nr:spry domain containing socs box protein [Anaeramoeba flamelloides]|eukprot:Anaeramoba_flamelloidesa85056_149.p1 GENE.a85056_149~~a85056_149.p1  ORF type:complete len:168 (-),score=25.71 a85056_149:231-734(-)